MLKYYHILIIALLGITGTAHAQAELPDGQFCFSNPATIHWEIGSIGSQMNTGTFRMFILEELQDGWVKVFYEGSIGYVQYPDCIGMAELHAYADPVIEDARRKIRADPEDHEALYYMARASITLGDYINGITYIEQALALDPRNVYYNAVRGAAYTEIGRADHLMLDLIPTLPLLSDWYIAGRGVENIRYSRYDDIPLIDHWMILRLMTWTIVAVPEGWLLSDDIGISFMGLNPEETSGSSDLPEIVLIVAQHFYEGPIDGMPDYLFAELAKSQDMQLIDSVVMDDDTGYVQIHFEDNDRFPRYCIVAFSRALPMDVDGGWRLFLYGTHAKEKWTHFYPLMREIISNARNLQFLPVGVILPSEINWREE